MTVALSDGTVARSGGKVIKNVAGYDLAKLFSGSFGTLGADPVGQRAPAPAARRRPRPRSARAADPASWPRGRDALAARAARARGARRGLARRARRAAGSLRPAVPSAARRARRRALMREAGLERGRRDRADDEALWDAPARRPALRRRARSSGSRRRPSAAGRACSRAAERAAGTLVGRAALGTSYVERRARGGRAAAARACPTGALAVVLDAPASCARPLDPWGRPRRRGARADAARQGAIRPGREPATRACSWEASDDGRVRRPPPARAVGASTTACTAGSAWTPARRTCCGRKEADSPRGRIVLIGRGARRRQRALGRDGQPLRPLPGLHGVRDRLPVRASATTG